MQYAGRLKQEIAEEITLNLFFFFFARATHVESKIEMTVYIMIFITK